MDGTATGGGGDYAYANQSTTLTFGAGEAKKTVNVTVFADTLVDDNETVILKSRAIPARAPRWRRRRARRPA